MLQYKVVELAVVTDETFEEALNACTRQGWHFDSIQFVVRDASKRPAMAFVLFTRKQDHPAEGIAQSSHSSTSR